ncbi:hypothetical protein ANCDUO_12315 [Ancylostoma duodenale]|uniref:Alpha/beta hydrolase fold-3 domain-containing protein n=1 Tax=Ancylostoma duodenale TaxID=51022 RepID=A0A0C2G954_9BILA|nr:hypothetical protein ANCDUO_12315 [Ancylostoma duodenale]
MYRTFATKGMDPDVSPLFGVSKDLPPALVLTAEFDILRDEGIQYAMKLKEEGVPCDWKHYKRAFHGVCNMPYSLVRRDMYVDKDFVLLVQVRPCTSTKICVENKKCNSQGYGEMSAESLKTPSPDEERG